MHIVYTHGFNSSPRSFNYLLSQLPEHEYTLVTYDSHQGLAKSIAEISKQLPDEPFAFVGHSLGGVVNSLIAEHAQHATHLITISSPLGGSKAAATLRWIPGYPALMHDITPSSAFIKAIAELKLKMPTISIISTGGNLPTSSEPNDSVVTVASQKALKFGRKHEVKANHFEVLLHDDTVKHIHNHLFKAHA